MPPPTENPDAASAELAKPSTSTPNWNPREKSDDDLYTVREIYTHFWGKDAHYEDTHSATLHASAENPHSLSWVLLFNGANPQWNSNGVIFVKSNLDLLPGIQAPSTAMDAEATKETSQSKDETVNEGGARLDADATSASASASASATETQQKAIPETKSQPNEGFPVPHPPIAIFSQPIRQASRSFKFLGWYSINRLQTLEPESEDLVRMLNKKWETVDRYGRVGARQRDASKWKESMSYRWAVLKLERTIEEKSEPQIERWDEEDGVSGGNGDSGKSVKERLAEVRLEDQKKSDDSAE